MRGKYVLVLIVLTVFLLLFVNVSNAEFIDNSNSRTDYAKSISLLTKSEEKKPLLQASAQKAQPLYTLVLFRTLAGVPEFDEYEPDILIAGPHGCYTAAFTDPEKAAASVEYLRMIPGIIYAELDGEVQACGDTDPGDENGEEEPEYVFHSSGAYEMGFREAANWCRKVGEGTVTVAVIDSGVYSHTLLTPRMKASGYDYVDGDNDSTNDTYGHGTHVAGIIVDCTPNLPVYIFPIRILNSAGKGSIANTTSAIFEAAEEGCDVINMSLVSGTHSEALEDAILYALGCGTTVVISAGNNNENTVRYCPVHMEEPGLIVVGACTGNISNPIGETYSNYGSSVDVYAFGTGIRSCSLSGGYASQSGTSQAAPHVSALCSIMKMLFPSIGCGQIERRVKTLAGDGEINVPNAALLVPQTLGIQTAHVYLPVGTRIKLLQCALPSSSFLNITWTCEDEQIALVDNEGVLTCVSEGITTLHGKSSARVEVSTEIHVIREPAVLRIPMNVEVLEREAFFNTGANVVILPDNIEVIEEGVFDQAQLKTVFYGAQSMALENIFDSFDDLCFVIREDNELYKDLNQSGIRYIIDCFD